MVNENCHSMDGLFSTFLVNFQIPDYWCIGKSVSRAFGTVKRFDKLRDLGIMKTVKTIVSYAGGKLKVDHRYSKKTEISVYI